MSEEKANHISHWIRAGVIGLVLFIFIRAFFFSSYEVEGVSMKPTLQDGNKLVVSKINYQMKDIRRFDVIVFHGLHKLDYVKRVIGLPGDTIKYENDQLYINGIKYSEPYLNKFKKPLLGQKMTGDFTLQEVTGYEKVPPNHLFVLGDNRLQSMDSRHFGFVSKNNVVGKVNVRYWPLKEFSLTF